MVHSNKEKEIAKNDPQNAEKYKTKSIIYNNKRRLDFRKYTEQIWLAGLGAFSKAEEEGNKLFDSLVEIGSELEFKTNDMADQTVESVSGKAKYSVIETKDKVEKLIDRSIHQSFHKIGLATTGDLQNLENLVLKLHKKLDILIKENEEFREQIKEK